MDAAAGGRRRGRWIVFNAAAGSRLGQMMLVSILLRFTRRAAAGAQALRLQRAPSRTVEDAASGTILTEPSIGAPSIPPEGRAERPTERTKINNQDQLVELRNDQVDPKEHEQRGDADQDIAQ